MGSVVELVTCHGGTRTMLVQICCVYCVNVRKEGNRNPKYVKGIKETFKPGNCELFGRTTTTYVHKHSNEPVRLIQNEMTKQE
jgi:hypothetical protein